MKLIKPVVLTAVIFSFFLTNAYGEDGGVNGLIIGGGTGALFGQTIGHNAESTIIGATAGGLLGYIIGNEIYSSHTVSHKDYNNSISFSGERNRQRHRPRVIKEKYRTYHNRGKMCRETITIIKKHGKKKRIVSTECWRERGYSPSPYYSSHRRKWDGDDMTHHRQRKHKRFNR